MKRRSALPSSWRRQAACAGCTLLAAMLTARNAPATWPPLESFTAADLANPANWPDDPDYGYDATHDGDWPLYSFTPTPSDPSRLRTVEHGKPAGMSVDLAWRWTIGEDAVRLGVADSGIVWADPELRERVALNLGELRNHKPLHADSSPCGGHGELEGFDCNGDGLVTVTDWAATPTLQPQPSEGHVLGDMNGNGVLDAGDLILNFSDGIDDDGNGYVDDIAGWDFAKDDNDPFDDTLHGGGTRAAALALGEGNNGIGGIGACPRCRLLPIRIADGEAADANALAEAVAYAADNRAAVVLCAPGAVDMSPLAQQALDYAFARGTLVVTSMGNDGSRRHTPPTIANHVLPVHAVGFAPAPSVTSAETFLAFGPCSNFGGQNLLSGSAAGCSDEAAALLAGAGGLLYSEASKRALAPPLAAGEAEQLFLMTADDVDVPESRAPGSAYRWSQPGFDQRFGYGRSNVNRALEQLRAGAIPPVVDLVSPAWFETLYADQLANAVPIHATVSALRAKSYDYTVEWAPGIEPLEQDYQPIAAESNLPPSAVAGSGGPLTLFDVRTIAVEHARDRDSPRGENDRTITLRVRATAHYGGLAGDARGEARRAFYVQRDPDLVEGFPIRLEGSIESSPKLADVDGDGVREIVQPTAGGLLHVLRVTPAGPIELTGFPLHGGLLDGLRPTPPPGKPSYLGAPAYTSGGVDPTLGRSALLSAPAVGDVNGDGRPELVVASWNGFVTVVLADGSVAPGWPKRLPEVPSCPLDGSPSETPCSSPTAHVDRGTLSAPVLVDLDGDARLEIVLAAFDGRLHAWRGDGTELGGWPVELHYAGPLAPGEPSRSRLVATPAVADFDGDGTPDLLGASTERLGSDGRAGALYLVNGHGTAAGGAPWLPSWPVTQGSLALGAPLGEGIVASPAVGRFDGVLAAVTQGNGSLPFVLPADPGVQTALGETPPGALPPERADPADPTAELAAGLAGRLGELSSAAGAGSMVPLWSQPTLGDVDQDGAPDVMSAGTTVELATALQAHRAALPDASAVHMLGAWSGRTGVMLPAAPFVLEDLSYLNGAAVADITGDDYPEIIAGSAGYFLHAFDGCGREPGGWPKLTGQWIAATPAVGDVDGDGQLEVVVGTRSGWLYAWHTRGRSDGIIEWESFHHDNHNSGSLETPLEQGDPSRRAAVPLTAAMCGTGPAPSPELEPAGGCACMLGRRPRSAPAATIGMLVVMVGLALRRGRTGRAWWRLACIGLRNSGRGRRRWSRAPGCATLG